MAAGIKNTTGSNYRRLKIPRVGAMAKELFGRQRIDPRTQDQYDSDRKAAIKTSERKRLQ